MEVRDQRASHEARYADSMVDCGVTMSEQHREAEPSLAEQLARAHEAVAASEAKAALADATK